MSSSKSAYILKVLLRQAPRLHSCMCLSQAHLAHRRPHSRQCRPARLPIPAHPLSTTLPSPCVAQPPAGKRTAALCKRLPSSSTPLQCQGNVCTDLPYPWDIHHQGHMARSGLLHPPAVAAGSRRGGSLVPSLRPKGSFLAGLGPKCSRCSRHSRHGACRLCRGLAVCRRLIGPVPHNQAVRSSSPVAWSRKLLSRPSGLLSKHSS